jgi:hypothetical protein
VALVVVALAAMALAPNTLAMPFERPPEQYIPGWECPFPYQRNIYWDFGISPVGGPSANGTPGAHYEGWLDDRLKVSDWVEFTGDVEWFPTYTDPVTGYVYTGVVGIDNRQGATTKSGTIVYHLDNRPDPNAYKDVYDEAVYIISNGSFGEYLFPPPGYDVSDPIIIGQTQVSTDPPLFLDNFYWRIKPNPPWEEKVMDLSVGPGGLILLDSYHIATYCMPEPATMTLLGGALAALVIRRRRRT